MRIFLHFQYIAEEPLIFNEETGEPVSIVSLQYVERAGYTDLSADRARLMIKDMVIANQSSLYSVGDPVCALWVHENPPVAYPATIITAFQERDTTNYFYHLDWGDNLVSYFIAQELIAPSVPGQDCGTFDSTTTYDEFGIDDDEDAALAAAMALSLQEQ